MYVSAAISSSITDGSSQPSTSWTICVRLSPSQRWCSKRTGRSMASNLPADARRAPNRSEEHTSELQSLMRISYAVFCLKKTKQHKDHTTYIHQSSEKQQHQ